MPHLATPLKDAVEGDEGGVGGVITPWVILGGGWINLSVTGNGGPCRRSPSFTGVILALRVTGTSHSPLRQGREHRFLIDRHSPSLDRIYQLGLWLAIFFAIFHSTSTEQISPIPPDLSPVSIRLALLFLLLFALRNGDTRCSPSHADT
jgi:hypothetical protein